ncbi:uncharacterized protein [Antedon mediterranea]|uniref:uncharacterized protein isoform X2 n=1 Tax=Antedon mediterranea TaxID=105859 RepID=UPI003AF7DBA8
MLGRVSFRTRKCVIMEGTTLMYICICASFLCQSVSAYENKHLKRTGFRFRSQDNEIHESPVRRSGMSPTNAEIYELFSLYDTSGDGVISRSELSSTIQRLFGHSFTDEALQIFNGYDTDNNSYVDYREFATMMRNENKK